MRRYETIFILDPDASEEQRGAVYGRISDLMDQKNGFQVALDEWGARKLAYDIKKKHRGYYVRLDYCGDGDLVDEIERFFRIDDRLLKYMTIVLDKDADLEAIKQEMADAEAKAEAAAKAAAEAAAAAKAAAEAAAEAAEAAAAEAATETPETEAAPETPEAEAATEAVAETAPESASESETEAAPAPAADEKSENDTDEKGEEA
jgi:small subunit ribosomal protein S6